MHTGDEYFDNDEFRDILAEYENANGEPSALFLDADDLTDIADYYTFVGNTKKATEAINTALDKFPGASGPLVYKAHEALKDDDIDAAYSFAEQMDDKDGVDYCYLQAELLIAQDRIDEADALLDDFLKYESYDDEREDFLLDVGEMYLDYEVYDKAYKWLSLATERDATDFRELWSRALAEIGREEESITLYNQLIDDNPYSKRLWLGLANAQMKAQQLDDALASVGYALAIDPNDQRSLLAKANMLHQMGNHQEALKLYEKYCASAPTNSNVELRIGTCLICTMRFREAIRHLQQAEKHTIPQSAQHADICHELAFAFSSIFENDKALRYIDKTKDMPCDHAEMEVLRGHVLLQNEKLKDATKAYWKAIHISNHDKYTVLRIIVSVLDNGYTSLAYTLFKRFFRSMPEDFKDGYSYMALCCYEMKKTDDFIAYLKKAVAVNPNEARKVLGYLFPAGMAPEDYCTYITKKTDDKKK